MLFKWHHRNPIAVDIGDLNYDHRLDIIVENILSSTVGNFNNDNFLDIVVVNHLNDNVDAVIRSDEVWYRYCDA